MQIFVNILSGKTICIEVGSSATVEMVKATIHEKQGIPPFLQRLMFAGKLISDSDTMNRLNVRNMSTMTMVLALRGGMDPELAQAAETGTNSPGPVAGLPWAIRRQTARAILSNTTTVAATLQTAAEAKQKLTLVALDQQRRRALATSHPAPLKPDERRKVATFTATLQTAADAAKKTLTLAALDQQRRLALATSHPAPLKGVPSGDMKQVGDKEEEDDDEEEEESDEEEDESQEEEEGGVGDEEEEDEEEEERATVV